MGVDQKRPLVGFAVVAVLCAVLMTLSVGRGWSVTDLFHPGRPIVSAAGSVRVDRAATLSPRPAEAGIPAELSRQPLGVAVGSKVVATAVSESEPDLESSSIVQRPTASSKDARAAEKAATRIDRAATKVRRQAERSAAKAQRQVEKAADKLTRKG